MSFFSLLFGNDVKIVKDRNPRARPGRAGKAAVRPRVGGDDVHRKELLKTPIGLVPIMSLRRFRGPKRSRLHTVAIPANRDRLSLWSLLLCQPEVYDPRVEAAPVPHLLDVNKPPVVRERAEQAGGQQPEHLVGGMRRGGDLVRKNPFSGASSGMGRFPGTSPREDVEGHSDDAEDEVMLSSVQNPSSDADEFAETDAESQSGESEAAEALLHPRAFQVFDTRRCWARSLTALPCWTAVTILSSTSPPPCGSVASAVDGTEGGAVSSRGSVASTERRLISRKELAKRRLQMRQQLKDAAKRAREYKRAWEALVAAAGPHANCGKEGEPAKQANWRCAEDGSLQSTETSDASSTSAVIISSLTNEALASLREDVQPLKYELPAPFSARLGHYTPLPKNGRGGTGAAVAALAGENEGAESCCSFSSDGSSQVVLDDELVNVETELPVIYGSFLRCRDSALKANAVGGGATPSRQHRKLPVASCGSQRIPAGKYALGSRAYVERVLFAQRRQQECALFALLTEAHRQARAVHLRLAQLYYYYVIPILAQYSTEEEVRGLERSLLQCGSGALRVFHTEFCMTTVRPACALQMSAAGGVPESVACRCQVQPVDYQLAEYRFEKAWRELFLEVKTYLGMQARDEAACSNVPALLELKDGAAPSNGTTSIGHGSVCVAATVLHSMELFERQRHTHSAARDAEEWLAWYYYYFLPHVQRASSAEERTAIQRSLLPPPPPSSTPECETETNDDGGESHVRATDPKSPQPHPLENEYLPLSWTRACDTAEREKVLGYRRDLKMRVIESALTARAAEVGGSAAESAVGRTSTISNAKPTSATIAISVAASRKMAGADATAASSELSALRHVPYSGDALSSAHEAAAIQMLATNVEADLEEESLRKPPSQLLDNAAISGQNYGAAEAGAADSEETEEEYDAVSMGAHQTVNAGCFGLSFFSVFD
ncbi:hypothetical protein LSCM1_01398 [Leishmania martiniquensis]|uniref:Uncharacterized protein n=1 Tax=Leishmania martiniquensis TaxID=1580590 RepID=A0A836KCI0_9TRYP|nr:hypothetical protein LSCM1_01398 [Leishmania martiniquensis]